MLTETRMMTSIFDRTRNNFSWLSAKNKCIIFCDRYSNCAECYL